MKLEIVELGDGITKLVLDGRMDIAGAQQVDMDFNLVSNAKRSVIVDMTSVSFLASMGLRTLLTAARTLKNNGGRLVLLNPDANVEKILIVSGTSDVMPIYQDLADACAALQ